MLSDIPDWIADQLTRVNAALDAKGVLRGCEVDCDRIEDGRPSGTIDVRLRWSGADVAWSVVEALEQAAERARKAVLLVDRKRGAA